MPLDDNDADVDVDGAEVKANANITTTMTTTISRTWTQGSSVLMKLLSAQIPLGLRLLSALGHALNYVGTCVFVCTSVACIVMPII